MKVWNPLPKSQPIPPLWMLGQELDEPSLGVGYAEVDEEPTEEHALRRVDWRPSRTRLIHVLPDVA